MAQRWTIKIGSGASFYRPLNSGLAIARLVIDPNAREVWGDTRAPGEAEYCSVYSGFWPTVSVSPYAEGGAVRAFLESDAGQSMLDDIVNAISADARAEAIQKLEIELQCVHHLNIVRIRDVVAELPAGSEIACPGETLLQAAHAWIDEAWSHGVEFYETAEEIAQYFRELLESGRASTAGCNGGLVLGGAGGLRC